MDTFDLFATVPADMGGALAKDRLDFQGHWAITLLLEEYMSSADNFVILFDYHDDVVLLKNDRAYFYQVKTSTTESCWTEKNLTGTYKKYLLSLYKHLIDFAHNTESLCLISNVPLEINSALTKDGKLKNFKQKYLDKLSESIKKKYELIGIDKRFIEIMSFKVASLDLDKDDEHIEGIFAAFIRAAAPDSDIDPYVVLSCLCRYIAKRNNFTATTLSGKELKSKKGVSRVELANLIQQINTIKMRDSMLELKNVLSSESTLTLRRKDSIVHNFMLIYKELLSGNRHTLELYKVLLPIADKIYKTGSHPTCFALLNDIFSKISEIPVFAGLNPDYLYGFAFFSYLYVQRNKNDENH